MVYPVAVHGETFQSTRPVGDATVTLPMTYAVYLFQSTRPVGDATSWRTTHCGSIPRFQSTRPVGDATPLRPASADRLMISIHASRGGRDGGPWHMKNLCRISIHASRGGRDLCFERLGHVVRISIHASRGGRDRRKAGGAGGWIHFNPRVPWGTRRPAQFRFSRRPCYFNPRVPWGTRQQHCTIYELYNAAYPPILYLEVASFLPTTSPSIHIFLKSFSFKGANHIGNL